MQAAKVKILSLIQERQPFYSMEFFPPKEAEQWPAFFSEVERLKALAPAFVSVTYGAGGSSQSNTLAITKKLAEKGFTPMAHLTCVGASPDNLRAFLGQLAEAGVHNVLALRGDAPQGVEMRWQECAFPYASDLAQFIRSEFPHFGVSVAAYLTPHPESDSFAIDREMTAAKLEYSDFAITQLFFDAREYFEYVAQMRAMGVTKPILPGVLPIQSLESIRRVLSLSGCNIPAKLYLSIEEAHQTGGANAVKEAGIAYAVEQIRRLIDGGAPGVHLYTLNKADVCLRIAEAVGPFA